jgi:hypothetical protein
VNPSYNEDQMNTPHQTSTNLSKYHRHALVAVSLVAVLFLLGCATARRRPALTPNPEDVDTIPDIMRASFETISGPAGIPRQWGRDRTLYTPVAIFVSVWEQDGRLKSKIMTSEEYRRGFKIDNGLFETEVGRRIECYGNVAQVRSVSVVRSRPDGPITERYVNYSQLYWNGSRWWITGQV